MTFKDSMDALVQQALDDVREGHEPMAVAVCILTLEQGTEGSQARIIVGHLAHTSILHQEVDVLEDFAEALTNKATMVKAEKGGGTEH